MQAVHDTVVRVSKVCYPPERVTPTELNKILTEVLQYSGLEDITRMVTRVMSYRTKVMRAAMAGAMDAPSQG
jgi:hypothetical protein